jgi:hypothetical protein
MLAEFVSADHPVRATSLAMASANRLDHSESRLETRAEGIPSKFPKNGLSHFPVLSIPTN